MSHRLNWQVAKLSLQTGFTSEYTSMTILEIDLRKKAKESDGKKVCIKSFEVLFPNKIDLILCKPIFCHFTL